MVSPFCRAGAWHRDHAAARVTGWREGAGGAGTKQLRLRQRLLHLGHAHVGRPSDGQVEVLHLGHSQEIA